MTIEDFENELKNFDFKDCHSREFAKWITAEKKAAMLEKISKQSLAHKELYVKYYMAYREDMLKNQNK